ncbi:MAG: HAMP domain-containing protein, partial [Defluviitaleaceae bacterium]|nr:HAMP domain-containing protein [Defluviitaleaceae bacterium]
MQAIRNMKIKSKLFLGFGVVLLALVVVAFMGATDVMEVDRRYGDTIEYTVYRYGQMLELDTELMDIRRLVTTIALQSGQFPDQLGSIEELEAQALSTANNVSAIVGRFRTNLIADPHMDEATRAIRITQADEIERLIYRYLDETVETVMEYARRGRTYLAAGGETIAQYREAAVYSIVDGREIMADIDVLSEEILSGLRAIMDGVQEEMYQFSFQTMLTLVVISVIGAGMGIGAALLIASLISKPVNELVGTLTNVASGNLNINMKTDLPKDEIGIMTQNVYSLINVIKGMVNDISDMSHEILDNGDIDYRIDVSRYQGSYNDMTSNLNSFVDGYAEEIQSIIAAMGNVADGNFNAELKKLPGKKADLNKALDGLISSLRGVMGEVDAMIESAAVKGDMHLEIDVSKYLGSWRKIMEGLNDIAKAVDAPVSEIMNIMNKLSKGDFSEHVSGNYAGDFLQMKNSVNSTIDNLSSYINEIADTLTRVSDGDLTISITREYLGSFVAIKDSLNTICKTLNKTMSEISSASDQVLSGAKQISASSMDLANGASTQASSIEELNA